MSLAALLVLFTATATHDVPRNDPCVRREDMETWIKQQKSLWTARLADEIGYTVPDALEVCELHARRPYTDVPAGRIYARAIATVDDQVSLVHEYLHLALRNHPHGRDETYVENLARELVHVGD